jgi:putative ABC transport system ATP-binding protein
MRIRAESLTRIYNMGTSKIIAVDNVNFDVSEEEFTAIVGRSGSGKSTLLNLIGLNDRPSSGKLLINNIDAFGLSNRELRKIRLRRMGFVFQTFNLFPVLSSVENVELPMALAGKSRETQREEAVRLLDAVGLGNRLTHRPKQLSMGEMQRVAIARALANDPEIVIADEPTGELDSKTAKEIIALLSDIHRTEKKTVIVATHDERVVEIVDTVYLIEDGKLTLETRQLQ